MPMTSKQMEKLLLQNGFIFQRQKGSHRVYYNPQNKRTVILPMHGTDLKKGTEQQILKDAGLK